MRGITIACWNRPKNLESVLSRLKGQMADLRDYKLFISCEPGNPEVIDIVKNIDFMDTDVVLNKTRLGLNANTFSPMDRAFRECDFNLYLEDDYSLSSDALDLFDWYTKQDLTSIGLLMLCNIWAKEKQLDENLIYKVRKMCGWGLVISRQQFKKYLTPAWFPKIGSWDNSLARYIRTFEGIYNLVPELSRSTNIGIDGVHMDQRFWDLYMKDHRFNTKREKFNYRLKKEYDKDRH